MASCMGDSELPSDSSGAQKVCCCSVSICPPPPRSRLFPYTTLFRSRPGAHRLGGGRQRAQARRPLRGVGAAQGHRHLHRPRSEEHTSELQSLTKLVCRLLLGKKKRHPEQL